jgi:hypothetical protein
VLEGPALSGLERIAPDSGAPPITPREDAERLDSHKG